MRRFAVYDRPKRGGVDWRVAGGLSGWSGPPWGWGGGFFNEIGLAGTQVFNPLHMSPLPLDGDVLNLRFLCRGRADVVEVVA